MKNQKFDPQILLPGHLLLASPNMDDPYFNKAVIILCSNDEEGGFGLLINRQIGYINAEVLEKYQNISLDFTNNNAFDVLEGGPVEADTSIVLTIKRKDLEMFDQHPVFTLYNNAEEYIADYIIEKSDDFFVIFRGYCSWAPGQLDQELADNFWITAKPSLAMLEDNQYKKKWQKCIKELKIKNLKGFVGYSGSS